MKDKSEREKYWHWFHGLTGISQKEKEELLNYCSDVKLWYEASEKQKTKELLGPCCGETEKQMLRKEEVTGVLESVIQRENLRKSYEKMKQANISMVTRESEGYPERLKHIFLPPMVLYFYGELPKEDRPSLAVIGARNCSV